MLTKKTIAAIALALLTAVPMATADWMGRGWSEPDTSFDQSNLNFNDPDTTEGASKVYFNVYFAQDDVTSNPNVGTLGSSVHAYPTRAYALIGQWKDCNGDGYVGNPEGFLQWYPSQLADASICPAIEPNYGRPGQLVVHNDGTWVRELLTIAPYAGDEPDAYWFNVDDPAVKVWGDWNLPNEGPIDTCPVTPLPQGSLQSTGGLLRYVDCHPSWRITGTVNDAAAAAGDESLGFSDAPRERPDQSATPLNQPNPYGSEEDASYVTVFDCSQPPVSQSVSDPTGGQLEPVFGDEEIVVNVTYMPMGTPAVNPDGSPAGTINETEEGVAPAALVDNWTGSCDREDDVGSNGEIYGLVESDHEGVVGARARTDFDFGYVAPSTSGCTSPNNRLQCTPDRTHVTGDASCYSAVVSFNAVSCSTDIWFGNPSYTASRNPFVNRETLVPWGASYASFYAYVSPSSGILPGGLGVYGSDHCNGLAPITGEFDCDRGNWYRGPDGEDISAEHYAYVGDEYNLRDVDCYDHSPSVNNGLPGLLSVVGERSCSRPVN